MYCRARISSTKFFLNIMKLSQHAEKPIYLVHVCVVTGNPRYHQLFTTEATVLVNNVEIVGPVRVTTWR